MGWVQRGAGKGMEKKTEFIPLSGVSRFYLPTYLGPSSALVLLCTPMKYDRGDEIQFFPFYRPSSGLPLSRKRSSPCDAPHAVVVGRSRICKFRRHIVSASCPLLTPSPSTKDSGQTFIRLRIFIFRSSETTKRVTPCRRKGDGTPR